MKYRLALPNGWKMRLVGIADPIEAYETMTNVAKAADETGFEALWLVDHFHTVPNDRIGGSMPSGIRLLLHGRGEVS